MILILLWLLGAPLALIIILFLLGIGRYILHTYLSAPGIGPSTGRGLCICQASFELCAAGRAAASPPAAGRSFSTPRSPSERSWHGLATRFGGTLSHILCL